MADQRAGGDEFELRWIVLVKAADWVGSRDSSAGALRLLQDLDLHYFSSKV
jgi:hypothetical protein